MNPNEPKPLGHNDPLNYWHTHSMHRNFVHRELRKVIEKDAFASRFFESLGSAIEDALVSGALRSEIPFDDRLFFIGSSDYLYCWINRSDGFDPNWLLGDDGTLRDDRGEVYEDGLPSVLSKQSQLAALGIYLIEDIDGMGERVFDESGYNPHGFSSDMWDRRNANRLLEAFQCLVYCQRLQLGESPSKDEEDRANKIDVEAIEKLFLAKRAKNAALAKIALDSDGKQAAKSEIKTEWEKWQKNPKLYKGKAAFARAMLDRYTNLESHRVIERWCKDWGESSQ
ncbi:hypothetical protein MCERE10_02543 [Burkholderiaceae bacterium]